LYDTAGQEKFRSLIPMYIRDAHIIIIVYDITNKESFLHTSHWLKDVHDLRSNDAIYALVGNKLDLNDKRTVTKEEGEAFAKEHNILFQEVSAKTGANFSPLFYKDIFDQIIVKFRLGGQVEEEEVTSNDITFIIFRPGETKIRRECKF
jgi:Ras-related protein Rab-6A